jgi:hypothetical protein
MAENPEEEAITQFRFGLFLPFAGASLGHGKGKAILCFEKVIQLVGSNSELGLKAAKQIETLKADGPDASSYLQPLGKDYSIERLTEVIRLAGANSELGLEAARSIESLKTRDSGRCFIATAVYGSALAPEVLVFRRYRDEVLLPSRVGASLVEAYYVVSPPLALLISKVECLKIAVRYLILSPILRAIKSDAANQWFFEREEDIGR